MGRRQRSHSVCSVPAVWLWLQGRGGWVERSKSRRPPWEEEMDKATSLDVELAGISSPWPRAAQLITISP